MKDFTLHAYINLLKSLLNAGYAFQPFLKFLEKSLDRSVIVRHDVDALPINSLETAIAEHVIGIRGSYYFRSVSQTFDEKIIREIASLGHEIGYHYENLASCRGDLECAIKDFEKNLERFRKKVPVKTICMHGSPLNRWDSCELWNSYNYRDYGIIGEPYFDVDYTKVLYLTDTGRRWDGEKYSVRDRVSVKTNPSPLRVPPLKTGKDLLNTKHKFRSTFDIIRAAERGELPDKIMINMHPQRWNDKPFAWLKEYVSQNIKNVVKRVFFVK